MKNIDRVINKIYNSKDLKKWHHRLFQEEPASNNLVHLRDKIIKRLEKAEIYIKQEITTTQDFIKWMQDLRKERLWMLFCLGYIYNVHHEGENRENYFKRIAKIKQAEWRHK